MRQRVIAVAMLSIGLNMQAQNHPQSRTSSFYTGEKEAALGAHLASQVRRQTTPLGVRNVDEYVKKLCGRLAAEMPNATENWTYSVVRDREGGSTREPLWLPGGYLFVPTGLMLSANNEAEFAGMLAHAMAHVAEGHALRQATHGEVAQLANVPLIFMVGVSGLNGEDEYARVPLSFLKIRRQFELEADGVAVRVMAATRFDPRALLSYIERAQQQKSMDSEAVSPLPPLSLRIDNLMQAIQNSRAPRLQASAESFYSVQDEVRRSAHALAP